MALHDPGNRTERADDRTERLAELTHEAADAMTQALAAGLPKTMQLIDEPWVSSCRTTRRAPSC